MPLPYRLFIDSTTEPAKARAIEDLVAAFYGGKVESARPSIKLEEHSGRLRLRVANEIDYTVRAPRNAPEPQDAEYMYPWLSELRQGVAVRVRYSPPGASPIQFEGTNSLSGTFRWPVRVSDSP